MGQLQKYRRILEKASKKRPGKLLALRKSGSPVRTKLGTGKSGPAFEPQTILLAFAPWRVCSLSEEDKRSRAMQG
jgi:hypothetical protein